VPAGGWVGFGRDYVAQPDLFEAVHRIGWWRLHWCRTCLRARIDDLEDRIRRFRGALHEAEKIAAKRAQPIEGR